MTDIKSVQALQFKPAVQRIMDLARRFRSAHGEDYDDAYKALEGAAYEALIAQMQRDAVQPASAGRFDPKESLGSQPPAEIAAYLRSIGDPDAAAQFDTIAAAPHPEAQALDSQLQQPDGHSVAGDIDASYDACALHGLAHPCEVCAAESVTAQMEAALAECRGLFPIPAPGEPAETEWLEAMSYPPSVPAFIRASLAATSSTAEARAQQQDDHAGSPAPSEPLFLLHCGKVDSSGEQDEWDVEANSGKAVDAFASMHPGKSIGLYPAPSAQSSKAALSDLEIAALAVQHLRAFAQFEGQAGEVWFEGEQEFARAILARAGIGESRHE